MEPKRETDKNNDELVNTVQWSFRQLTSLIFPQGGMRELIETRNEISTCFHINKSKNRHMHCCGIKNPPQEQFWLQKPDPSSQQHGLLSYKWLLLLRSSCPSSKGSFNSNTLCLLCSVFFSTDVYVLFTLFSECKLSAKMMMLSKQAHLHLISSVWWASVLFQAV